MRATPNPSGDASHCIRVTKVYDWVAQQVHIPVQVKGENIVFTCPQGDWDPCQLGENVQLKCLLSDQNGNRVNPLEQASISCEEIPQVGGRRNVKVTQANGKRVNLQKVKIAKQGFIVVEVKDTQRMICRSQPIPFHVDETFYLCAPPGTTINCEITDFDCDVYMRCDNHAKFQDIFISIDLCQEIQVEAMVKVLVEGELRVIKKIIKEKKIIEVEEEEEEEEEE